MKFGIKKIISKYQDWFATLFPHSDKYYAKLHYVSILFSASFYFNRNAIALQQLTKFILQTFSFFCFVVAYKITLDSSQNFFFQIAIFQPLFKDIVQSSPIFFANCQFCSNISANVSILSFLEFFIVQFRYVCGSSTAVTFCSKLRIVLSFCSLQVLILSFRQDSLLQTFTVVLKNFSDLSFVFILSIFQFVFGDLLLFNVGFQFYFQRNLNVSSFSVSFILSNLLGILVSYFSILLTT